MYEWLPLADCLEEAGLPRDANPEATPSAGHIERKRAAAAAYVERNRPDLLVAGDPLADPPVPDVFTPPADVVAGAVLLTARLYARKGSPLGVASFGEFGPADVLRYDADIERLLGLGRYAPPVVG